MVQFLLDRQQTLRELEQVNLTKLVASLLNQQGDTGAESFIAYCIQEKFIYLDTNKVPLPAVMVDDRFRDHFGFSSTSR